MISSETKQPEQKPTIRFCKAEIRNPATGKQEPCPQGKLNHLKLCDNRHNHVWSFSSGMCKAGWHEGSRPASIKSGEPFPVCDKWLNCACECHTRITMMFNLAEEPRAFLDNPEYSPGPKLKFVMPDPLEILAERAKTNTVYKTEVIQSDNPDIPLSVVREYEPTESGRAGRGQLEQNVKAACDAWVAAGSTGECTTKWVSDWVVEHFKIDSSRGAIDAAWKRWVEIGFAWVAHKPTRFVCYTPDGVEFGLDELKKRSKRGSKIS